MAFSMSCKKPTDPNSSELFRKVTARINVYETVIKDSSVVSKISDIKSIEVNTKYIYFGFNDSIWTIDSSKIFVSQSISTKILSQQNQEIAHTAVSDSSIVLLGQKFKYNWQTKDSVRLVLENANNSNEIEIIGKVVFDSLHIPIFIEMGIDTIVSFISNLSIENILDKRKSILNAPLKYYPECCPFCDTICIPIVRILPYGFNNLTTYIIGEMVIPYQ